MFVLYIEVVMLISQQMHGTHQRATDLLYIEIALQLDAGCFLELFGVILAVETHPEKTRPY